MSYKKTLNPAPRVVVFTPRKADSFGENSVTGAVFAEGNLKTNDVQTPYARLSGTNTPVITARLISWHESTTEVRNGSAPS